MPTGPGSTNTPTNAISAIGSSTGHSLFLENTNTNAGTYIRFRPGFNNFGFFELGSGFRESKDNYPVPQGGISKRMNQGGYGFPFPIGPTGNVYDWKPNAHTGWNINNRYNDTTKKTSTIGLADTYTTNSPIDDMYNKLNLRTDSHNKNSWGLATDQPYILRGIQRKGSTEPQYWGGFADTLTDTPRGGLLTALEREVIDKVRIGKFLISPKGIFFAAKQLGLQMMNPNVEGYTGRPSYNPIFNTKLWNPLSLFSLNTPVPYHITRHGIPGDPTGLSAYGYEKTINKRNISGFGKAYNRLVQLETEAFDSAKIPIGMPYGTLGGFTSVPPYIGGPKSFLGLGFTHQHRYTNTSLRQSSLLLGAPGLEFVTTPYPNLISAPEEFIVNGSTYDITRYKDDNTYTSPDALTSLPGPSLTKKYNSPLTKEEEAEWAGKGIIKLHQAYDEIKKDPAKSKVLGKNDGNIKDIGKRYATVAYGNLNRTTTDGSTSTIIPNDFRDNVPLNRANYGLEFSQRPKNTGVGKNATDQEYKDSNLVKRIGIGDYGDLNTMDRSNPRYVIDNKATVITSHKDKADQLVLGNSTKDLVQFSMTTSDGAGNPDKVIRFRSYINSISTNWSVEEADGIVSDYNQVLKSPIYTGVSHQLTIDFSIPVLSAVERTAIMNKLNTLAKLFYGNEVKNEQEIVDANGNVTTKFDVTRDYVKLLPLRIGNFIKMPCVMTSLSYDIDNETSWDIDNETPMVIQCSIGVNEISYKGNPSATNNIRIIGF
jgi:hypothetical protein